jgi:hypothetical protein
MTGSDLASEGSDGLISTASQSPRRPENQDGIRFDWAWDKLPGLGPMGDPMELAQQEMAAAT